MIADHCRFVMVVIAIHTFLFFKILALEMLPAAKLSSRIIQGHWQSCTTFY